MRQTIPTVTSLIVLCILFIGAGCIPPNTPPAAQPTPTIVPGWDRFAREGQCGYAIDFPSDMAGAQQDTYSWIASPATADPGGPAPNFIYISVIPNDFQNNGNEIIYNYDPVDTRTLLSLQVGESRSLRDDPNLASWFTYTRLQDATLDDQAAQTYENDQPWEFPPGTKEIRYYIQANDCTYLVGGYMATVGSGQPGAMDQERFEQVVATFQLAP